MSRTIPFTLLMCLLLAVGVAFRATAAQDRTAQLGQPTQERVWIQNRGDAEAIPVRIESVAGETLPLRVQVVGAPIVSGGPMRAAQWEYQNVTIPAGQDPTAVLNTAGAEGWEATGVVVPAQGASLIVMKRPR
jgi:hypothetical protein